MPTGENLTPEHQKAAARKHGADSMLGNPLAAWAEADRDLALAVAEELKTRELAELHVRLLAGKACAMLEALTAYIVKQLKDGVPVEELPSFNRWPAFFNSYAKALKMALALTDGKPDPADMIDLSDLEDKTG